MKERNIKNNLRCHIISVILLGLIIVATFGCKKFIEVGAPVTSINAGNVYTADATAIAVLTGIYLNMSIDDNNSLVNTGAGFVCMSLYPGLSADELTLYSGVTDIAINAYYKNSLNNSNTGPTDFWNKIYPVIYKINAAIEGLNASGTLTKSVKNQLLGEAYFLRAFSYFQLVNLYGDIPLVLNTDYNQSSMQANVPKDQIYIQMVQDLLEAQNLLADVYYDATLFNQTSERVRPNKSAATALLARVYLFKGDWSDAETQSTVIIKNSATYDIVPLDDVFLRNSKETIWALQPVDVGLNANTGEGRLFILPSTGPSANFPDYRPVYLNNNLINSFETGDQRLSKWIRTVSVSGIDYSYAYKYKIGYENTTAKEYPIVLRFSEQYLIRAEARARQGNVIGVNSAKSDLDVIRRRAGLPGTGAATEANIISAIIDERRHELFTEWGLRWLDLKRTNLVNSVMPSITSQKGGTWDNRWALYPIPLSVVQISPNLKQNPGYE